MKAFRVSILVMPPRIHPIHRIAKRIAVPVGPDPRLGHLPPIRLQKHAQLRIVIPRVQILQARLGIKALADPAFALLAGGNAGPGRNLGAVRTRDEPLGAVMPGPFG